jgi:hypothetical protein
MNCAQKKSYNFLARCLNSPLLTIYLRNNIKKARILFRNREMGGFAMNFQGVGGEYLSDENIWNPE